MPKNCKRCNEDFSWIRKEVSCGRCNESYCSKCANNSSKLNDKNVKVCPRCHNILSGVFSDNLDGQKTPPEVLTKRETLWEEGKLKPQNLEGPINSKNSPTMLNGLSKTDREIAERLNKLKDDSSKNAPNTSTAEIASRLAKHKGITDFQTSKPHVFKKETRCEQQQIDDLLTEINEEVELDRRYLPPVEEIEKRLNLLKGAPTDIDKSMLKPKDFNTIDEKITSNDTYEDADDLINFVKRELEIEKSHNKLKSKSEVSTLHKTIKTNDNDGELEEMNVVNKILEEAKLEEENKLIEIGSTSNIDVELPFCCLCNGNAIFNCKNCEELFCQNCLKNIHNKDCKNHKIEKFQQTEAQMKLLKN